MPTRRRSFSPQGRVECHAEHMNSFDSKAKHACRMQEIMREINLRFEPNIVRAIDTHNYGLMNDILKVFTGNADEIIDINGNNLVAQATIANDP